MAQERVFSTEGIVLRRIDYGEADRILTIFTRQHGKLRAIAKGARKTTSRLAGPIELLTRTRYLLATGRDLAIVTQCEVQERFEHLREHLWHASAGYYVAEALDRAVEDHQEQAAIYALGCDTLRRLNDDAAAWLANPTPDNKAGPTARGWAALRWFELNLLDSLGYRPSFHACVVCETPLMPVEENGFNAELGGAVCPTCGRYAQRRLPLLSLKVLRLVHTTEWSALPVMRLDARTRGDVEEILQQVLVQNIEHALRSWNFLHYA